MRRSLTTLLKLTKVHLAFVFAAGLLAAALPQQVTAQVSIGVGIELRPPGWAPHYERVNEVRYYYLPDIETYYDVQTQEYVYLDNGQWIFTPTLPAIYAGYDIYNGHVVVLDRGVREPWRFHHMYLAHYPRYYYHSAFRGRDMRMYPDHPRGFNENERRAIYEPRHDMGGRVEERHPEGGERRSQPVDYRGRGIGQPVRVTREMRGR